MKLDPAALRYLTDDDFRVLIAVEMGMRNHELVPIPLISAISGLRHGGYMKSLKEAHKHKLVHKETKRYVGYRLTSLGYDFLALRALVKRGVIEAVGRPLGVGKEADVVVVSASEQLMDTYPELADTPYLAMKVHRLGRTSFRAVKSKRDYLVHRKSASWIYFSRLAAMKEYAFMCALHERGFPVPRPLGQSRHVVVMELCSGCLLNQINELEDAVDVAGILMEFAIRLAQHGLVHCDLNEFNIMVDDDGTITVIDFPQMVSTSHTDAEMLFDRDIDGIRKFFNHRFKVPEEEMMEPKLKDILAQREGEDQLDAMVSASGFKNVNEEGLYGVQDDVQDDVEDVESPQIDPRTLEPAMVEKDAEENGEQCDGRDFEATLQEQDGTDEVDSEEPDTDSDETGAGLSTINRSLIEARVRRQRTNQSQRRQFAKRNIVKDSEKRKVKVEMDSGIW